MQEEWVDSGLFHNSHIRSKHYVTNEDAAKLRADYPESFHLQHKEYFHWYTNQKC